MKAEVNTKTSDIKLRFGIMCSSCVLQQWQADCISLLLKNDIELCLLIKDDNPVEKKSFIKKIISYPYSKVVFRVYNRFFLRPVSKFPVDLENEFKDVPVIYCKTKSRKYSQYFYKEAIEKIKSFNLDFILRFGFNIIRGEILNSAKYGIWSFHHDDEQKYRGVPSCFREIVYDDDVNGAILQRLTNKLDGGIILKKAYFKTIKHSYAANIDQLYFETSKWPLQICIDIKNDVANYFKNSESNTNALSKHIPNNFQMLWFFVKIFINKIKFHYEELFKPEQWNIGIIHKPINTFLKIQSVDVNEIFWLTKPKRGIYFSDPFGFKSNGFLQILYENYNYRTRRANISKIEFDLKKKSIINNKIIIDKTFHLSFPYVFEYNDEIFCMPEASQNNQIDLYKFDKEDDVFVPVSTILRNVDAVDTTLFNYEGLWWLFFTRKEQSGTNLYAYYSKEIFGAYEPHKNNPIKTDVRSSRPAGTAFYYDGNLYRPAQNCSKTYGGEISINKIIKLNPFEFDENVVAVVKPFQKTKFNKGIHTLSSVDDYTIIDAKRFAFVMNNFIFQFKRKIKKLMLRK